MEQTAEMKITAVTMSDCNALVELTHGFDFMILGFAFFFALALGFFLGRSFLTGRSACFDVRLRRHDEIVIDSDEV